MYICIVLLVYLHHMYSSSLRKLDHNVSYIDFFKFLIDCRSLPKINRNAMYNRSPAFWTNEFKMRMDCVSLYLSQTDLLHVRSESRIWFLGAIPSNQQIMIKMGCYTATQNLWTFYDTAGWRR